MRIEPETLPTQNYNNKTTTGKQHFVMLEQFKLQTKWLIHLLFVLSDVYLYTYMEMDE